MYKSNLTMKQNFNVSNHQSKIEASALDCLANYNVPFGQRSVYVFEYDGTFRLYDSVQTVQNKHGKGAIAALQGKVFAIDGKAFVYAEDIETSDGIIDIKALKKVMKNFKFAKNQPVYAIAFPPGNIKRFNTIGEAAEELGISPTGIYKVLDDTNPKNVFSGYTFVSSYDVEKRDSSSKLIYDNDGNPVVDKKKINKAKENFLYTAYNYPVARISVSGDVTVFESGTDFEEKTQLSKKYLYRALTSNQKYRGYSYARLVDIVAKDKDNNVLFNKDGTFMIDSEKVNAHIKRVFKTEKS